MSLLLNFPGFLCCSEFSRVRLGARKTEKKKTLELKKNRFNFENSSISVDSTKLYLVLCSLYSIYIYIIRKYNFIRKHIVVINNIYYIIDR